MNIFSGYNFTLSGSCAPQFEPLRRELEEYFRSGMESRAQLCVYIGEEKVIGKFSLTIFKHTLIQSKDLHSSIYDNDDFGPSNLIPIFSAGKVRYNNRKLMMSSLTSDADFYSHWSPRGQSDSGL